MKRRDNPYYIKFILILFCLLTMAVIQPLKSQNSINNFDLLDQIPINQDEELSFKSSYYEKKSLEFLDQDSFLLALEFAAKTEKKALIEKDYLSLSTQYIVKGHVYLYYGTFVKALDNFSKAEKHALDHDIEKIVINAKYGLGLTYSSLEKYDEALTILFDGLKLAKNSEDPRDQAMIYNAIGRAYQGKGELDSSLVYLYNNLKISERIEDTIYIIYALINIGESHRLQGDTTSAITNYMKAEQLNLSIDDIQAKAAIFGNLGIIYTSRENYEKANIYYRKSIDLCYNNHGLSSYLLLDLKSLTSNFGHLKQYDSAYVYFKEYLYVSDSVMQSDHQEKLSTLHYSQELIKKDIEAKIINQKLFTRSIITISITLLSVLIVLLIIMVNSRNKLKIQKAKEEMKLLKLILDKKNRALMSSLIDDKLQTETSADINELLYQIDIEGINDASINRLKLLETKLKGIEVAQLAWNSFKLHFEQVHPDFFDNLNKTSSLLTTNDLRFCAYMKLKLSTDEIAGLSNISSKSAQATILRLRKKLNIPNNTDLVLFIDSI